MQDYSRFTEIFGPYLDPKSESLYTQEQGLVPDAPPEAVKAYEEFKKEVEDIKKLEDENEGLHLL